LFNIKLLPMREGILAVLVDVRADSAGVQAPILLVPARTLATFPFEAFDEVRPVRRDTM
jgi:hypothetical protein